MKMNPIKSVLIISAMLFALTSCNDKGTSNTTGWKYNDAEEGGFQVVDDYIQETPPGMVSIGGGTFSMGRVTEEVFGEWNNYPRRVTVSNFFMDEYEISNLNWKEYVYWMELMFPADKEMRKAIRPDSTVWQEELAYNEPYLEYYYTHVAYDMYPVVGVSWEQAVDYCSWRTDRVNELILVHDGVIEFPDFAAIAQDSTRGEQTEGSDSIANKTVFNTGKYLTVKDYDPDTEGSPIKTEFGDVRKTNMSDGLLLPEYRLPTEAEWEFAAYGISSDEGMENYDNKRIFPWDGAQTRNADQRDRGKIMANFSRGRGDMMGVSGDLNDKATITAPVNSFWPNDFGLYNMAGNVNEWVMDVYRPASSEDVSEYNPFRGNVYETALKDKEGIYEIDSLGRLTYGMPIPEKDSTISNYDSLKLALTLENDVRDWRDGDAESGIEKWKELDLPEETTQRLYEPDSGDPESMLASHITNESRVYKGGSWKDRSLWLSPAQRRYLDQKDTRNDIGFRCAMSRIGSEKGNNAKQ